MKAYELESPRLETDGFYPHTMKHAPSARDLERFFFDPTWDAANELSFELEGAIEGDTWVVP